MNFMKTSLALVTALVFTTALLGFVSDDVSGVEEHKENALMPDIYYVKVGDINDYTLHTMDGGWAASFLFVDGSTREAAFLKALDNKKSVFGLPQDNTWDKGDKVIYVVSMGSTVSLTIDGAFRSLTDKDIKYGSETKYRVLGGSSVIIHVNDYISGLVFGYSYSNYSLSNQYNEIYVISSGDYMLRTSNSIYTTMYVTYTIEYAVVDGDNALMGWACVILAILGVVAVIWFGRPQKLS